MVEMMGGWATRGRRRALLGGASGLAALLLWAGVGSAAAEGPQRIVSVGGAVTEVLYRLGEGARVAAVDTTSVYPQEATAKPNVGYMRALSAEGVLSLSPDLILIEDGAGPPEAVALLDQAGVDLVHVRAGHDAAGIAEKIETVAIAVGREADGKALARAVTGELAELEADLASVQKQKRVLFILSLVDDRPMAAGVATAADGIIALAGAENAISDMTGYKALSWEAAAALQPDVVLMMDRGGPSHDAAATLAMPALAETPAGRAGALIKMDGAYLLGFGPRTPAAARDLAARLYPDLGLADPGPERP